MTSPLDTNALTMVLDSVHAAIAIKPDFRVLRALEVQLRAPFRRALSLGIEDEFITVIRKHPLYELAKQDPFTWRCNDKPRGYAGDAVMLDYVYSRTPPADTTSLGCDWFDFTTTGSMALSVRNW